MCKKCHRTVIETRNEAEFGALVRNNDSPKDGLYSDRESFALASLVLYIQPFENRSVGLLVSYSTSANMCSAYAEGDIKKIRTTPFFWY